MVDIQSDKITTKPVFLVDFKNLNSTIKMPELVAILEPSTINIVSSSKNETAGIINVDMPDKIIFHKKTVKFTFHWNYVIRILPYN